MTAFFDLLTSDSLAVDHDQIKAVHADAVARRKELGEVVSRFRDAANDYRAKVTELLTGPLETEQKKEGLRKLRESVYERSMKTLYDEEKGWVKRLKEAPGDEVAQEVVGTYFQLFTDMGFFNAAIKLYEEIPKNSEIRHDTVLQVALANAYNYRADKVNAADAGGAAPKYMPNPDPRKAMEIVTSLEGIVKDDRMDYVRQYLKPKIMGIKARAELLLAEENAKTAADPDAVMKEGLRKAHQLYKDNFSHETGYHHYSGYNAMLTAALMGDLKEAKAIAPKLFMATMRDNGLFANDPLTVFRTTMAMIIAPEVMKISPDAKNTNNTLNNALASLQSKMIEPWQRHAFMRDCKQLAAAMKGDGPNETRIRHLIEDRVLPALERKEIFKPIYVGSDDNRRALLDFYAYTSAANAIIPGAGAGKGVVLGGNLSKGGLISDMNISSQVDYFSILPLVSVPLKELEKKLHSDGKVFPDRIRDKTLKELALENKIGGDSKSGDYYEAIRLLVREVFHTKTRNMENMGSKGHAEFEEGLRNIYALTGMSHDDLSALNPKAIPSDKDIYAKSPCAANATHLLALRLGDCRMYKVMSGLFHRIASAAAQNDVIHALDQGKINADEALEKARDIRRVQLVNFDLDLYSTVDVGATGWAERNDKGYFVKNKDGKMGYIEPHSVNLLVERKPTGEIENLFLACTFYNGEYRDEYAKKPGDKDAPIVNGATYDLRVAITPDMVKRVDKGPGQKPEFSIDLTGKTGFKVWDPETGKAVDNIPLIAKSNKYSHANAIEYGPTNTRKLYSRNPSSFLSSEMPPFVDLEMAWDKRLDVRAGIIASEVDNIRHGRPPADLPARSAGTGLDGTSNRLAV